jgi:hypothetical protein
MTRVLKKVTYCEQNKIYLIDKNDDIRCGNCWKQMAVDRLRFKRRINEINDMIGYIFSENHRIKIRTSEQYIKAEY